MMSIGHVHDASTDESWEANRTAELARLVHGAELSAKRRPPATRHQGG